MKHKDNLAAIKREMADEEVEGLASEFVDELEPDDMLPEADYLNKRQYSVDENSGDFVSVGELNLMDSVELSTMRIKGNNRYKVKVLHERGRALSGIGEADLEASLREDGGGTFIEESEDTDSKVRCEEELNSQVENTAKKEREKNGSTAESDLEQTEQNKENLDAENEKEKSSTTNQNSTPASSKSAASSFKRSDAKAHFQQETRCSST